MNLSILLTHSWIRPQFKFQLLWAEAVLLLQISSETVLEFSYGLVTTRYIVFAGKILI